MAAVRMYIDKFKGVVLINEDHPLAVAQKAKEAAGTADTQQATAPAAMTPPASQPLATAPQIGLAAMGWPELKALAVAHGITAKRKSDIIAELTVMLAPAGA